jgi:hypothetical protein
MPIRGDYDVNHDAGMVTNHGQSGSKIEMITINVH